MEMAWASGWTWWATAALAKRRVRKGCGCWPKIYTRKYAQRNRVPDRRSRWCCKPFFPLQHPHIEKRLSSSLHGRILESSSNVGVHLRTPGGSNDTSPKNPEDMPASSNKGLGRAHAQVKPLVTCEVVWCLVIGAIHSPTVVGSSVHPCSSTTNHGWLSSRSPELCFQPKTPSRRV